MDVTSPAPAPVPAVQRQPPLGKRLLAPLGTLAAVVGAFVYVGSVDPNQPGHYPVCPLLAMTGILCPGCGGLRSAHAVAHGDLVGAVGANAMAVLGYAAFAVFMVVWITRAVKGRRTDVSLKPVQWWVLGGLFVVFSVVRNLPFGSALAP
ncbi:DUF2752 domain-containing protein [Streptomyces sp. NBC_00237]|uniref:DUF2752 domain-containing protein n=1 Tax=Streptomyces sp. NBC_00237 TaxID=2975687 RepID=UPI00225552BE|nr:DUF2752 domain-containing protein [Streptomyces sp. NBC_00237]MCX5201827.1 DUF2752 domain-containing protein [Streptomyces sp. NBC_00237]